MSNRFCLSSSVDNLNHGDCVIVTIPSDALCFAEPGSLETLGWGCLLPRWSWKTSCWTKIPKCPDSPSVWIIARIGYFTFFFSLGFSLFAAFWRTVGGFCVYAFIGHVDGLAPPHFARISLREQVSGFMVRLDHPPRCRDQLVKDTALLVHLCCCQNKHGQAHYSQLIRIKY